MTALTVNEVSDDRRVSFSIFKPDIFIILLLMTFLGMMTAIDEKY